MSERKGVDDGEAIKIGPWDFTFPWIFWLLICIYMLTCLIFLVFNNKAHLGSSTCFFLVLDLCISHCASSEKRRRLQTLSNHKISCSPGTVYLRHKIFCQPEKSGIWSHRSLAGMTSPSFDRIHTSSSGWWFQPI